MNTLTKIVTHAGSAHRDEFLACCLLLAKIPVPIERRAPEPDDLGDASIAVVDVGHEFDFEKRNFDHHQFPNDSPPICALSLVLKYLELDAPARQFCNWLETTEYFDCRGPNETCEWLGVSREQMKQLDSPTDHLMLGLFSASASHHPGEFLWETMRAMGGRWMEYLEGMSRQLAFLEAKGEFWRISENGGEFEAFAILDRGSPLGDATAAVDHYLKSAGKEATVTAIVYPDNRGDGYGLRTFNDHPSMDFCRIESEPDVHFCHKRGFIAKTSAQSAERLQELLGKAHCR